MKWYRELPFPLRLAVLLAHAVGASILTHAGTVIHRHYGAEVAGGYAGVVIACVAIAAITGAD